MKITNLLILEIKELYHALLFKISSASRLAVGVTAKPPSAVSLKIDGI